MQHDMMGFNLKFKMSLTSVAFLLIFHSNSASVFFFHLYYVCFIVAFLKPRSEDGWKLLISWLWWKNNNSNNKMHEDDWNLLW